MTRKEKLAKWEEIRLLAKQAMRRDARAAVLAALKKARSSARSAP